MDALKSWGLAVCFAALAAGIAAIITPSGKMEKMFKLTISLFFLCCILVPLFSLGNIIPKDIKLTDQSSAGNTELNSAVTEQAEDISSQKLRSMVIECCKSEGVTPLKVEVKIITNKDGSMNAETTEVTLSPKDFGKIGVISDAVKQKTGLKVKFLEGEKQ